MDSLQGQSAIVTGGTRGIGRAIAAALLDEGVRVAICGRSQEGVDRAVAELSANGQIVGQACDAGRYEQVERFYEFVDDKLGDLDILVNNAGVGAFAPVDRISVEQWRQVIDVNLSGPFYFTKLAVPRMRRRGGGFILNIGSLAGRNPFASGAAYNASKFGLNGFSEAVMIDLRHDKIRVSQIMPGSVQTEFTSSTEGAEWKLDPSAIAATAVHLIKTPDRNLASRIEMRPSRPPKR